MIKKSIVHVLTDYSRDTHDPALLSEILPNALYLPSFIFEMGMTGKVPRHDVPTGCVPDKEEHLLHPNDLTVALIAEKFAAADLMESVISPISKKRVKVIIGFLLDLGREILLIRAEVSRVGVT